jgi:superfamily II DNA or RNA helicase
MKSIVSHRGYSISKTGTDEALQDHHRKRLTVVPHIERQEYAHLARPIRIYQETDKRLYMPRFYGTNEIGPADTDKLMTKEFEHCPRLKFKGKLRPNQIPVVKIALKSLEQRGGGVIAIECGGGKTTCALVIGSRLNTGKPPPMAVVCHTTAMMKQWQERIHQFVPTAKIGLVQRDKCIIENKDIIIMSVKTVAKRKYSKHAFERIGFVVWDEIHLMCTDLFSKAFPKLATKYTLGLSATPYRKDRCDIIFQSFIGPVVYMRKRKKDCSIEARCVTLLMDDIEMKLNRYHKIMYTPTTVACVNRPERTQCLAEQLIAPLAVEGRTILVLGEYVKQLKDLKKKLDGLKLVREENGVKRPVTIGLYIGEMKNEQRKESESKDIILGTYKLASVGMDIPSLNTLVFASPRKEIEQSVGRILRKTHARFPPLIIDVIDNHSLFRSQSRVRKKFYRTYGYTIIHIRMELDGTIKSTRRTKPKVDPVAIDSPPSSDESGDEAGESECGESECMFD